MRDPYIGAMKGAILSVNPDARITDIAHQIRAQDQFAAAFILSEACTSFPAGTIHVAIIDPGVGGPRMPVIIETKRYLFVGPDNGIFSLALNNGNEEILRTIRITNEEYFPGPVSTTFHGRDIFAPIAGHLSLGLDPGLMGEETDSLVELSMPKAVAEESGITGEVVHIDGFGNLITNIGKASLTESGKDTIISVRGKEILGIQENYCESAREDTLCAIIGSTGLLEIAVNMGSAKERLNAGLGEKVLVSL
jgi:hypothetical protein